MAPFVRNTSWLIRPLILCLLVHMTISQETRHDPTANSNIEIRVFNHDYRATVAEVLRTLHTAQLELRGFTKSVINQSIKTAHRKPVQLTLLHFYKTIPCNSLFVVERELRRLLPGVWDVEVARRVDAAAARTTLKGGKMCAAGIEIHFPPKGGCAAKRDGQDDECDDFCLFCFYATADN